MIMQQPIMLTRETDFDTCHPDQRLTEFLSFCNEVVSRYNGNIAECEAMDNTLNDLLHYVEMTDDCSPKICVAIRDARRQRRLCKNENDLLKPLYEFLSDKTLINKLGQVLGRVRAANDIVTKRAYIARTDAIEKLSEEEEGEAPCQTQEQF